MNLHLNKKLFSEILRATSLQQKLKLEYVEKDYWMTLILNKLSQSKFSNECVFKGGTSLSKGYGIIKRFSEDIDIAFLKSEEYTGNQIKQKIREIEKNITIDLEEKFIEDLSRKGSKYRKSVFEYQCVEQNFRYSRIIVEINSFDNPIQFQEIQIKSFITEFLIQSNKNQLIEDYELHPFIIRILNKEQTLIEKLVSLYRFSFDDNHIESLSSKIRHFYDIYFLANDNDCIQFIDSTLFKIQFEKTLIHDKDIFEEPKGWHNKSIKESPLFLDFEVLWKSLHKRYIEELTALSYDEIPKSEDISTNFKKLICKLL